MGCLCRRSHGPRVTAFAECGCMWRLSQRQIAAAARTRAQPPEQASRLAGSVHAWVQGVLHWVAEPQPGAAPPPLEARLYGTLFRSQSPGELGDEWLADLNPESLATVSGALAGPALAGATTGDWCAATRHAHAGVCRVWEYSWGTVARAVLVMAKPFKWCA